jgi:hypothetical protein
MCIVLCLMSYNPLVQTCPDPIELRWLTTPVCGPPAGRDPVERQKIIRDPHLRAQYNANAQLYADALHIEPEFAIAGPRGDLVRREPRPPPTRLAGNRQNTAAEGTRKARAKRIAEHRRTHPAPVTRRELFNTERLQDKTPPVNKLTWCVHERKKTLNLDSVVLPFLVRGVRRYRLKSTCRSCFRAKSTFLSSGDSAPETVHGGRI